MFKIIFVFQTFKILFIEYFHSEPEQKLLTTAV